MRKVIKFVNYSATLFFIFIWISLCSIHFFTTWYYYHGENLRETHNYVYIIWSSLVFLLYLIVGIHQFGKFFEIGIRTNRKIEVILISVGWCFIYLLLILLLLAIQGGMKYCNISFL